MVWLNWINIELLPFIANTFDSFYNCCFNNVYYDWNRSVHLVELLNTGEYFAMKAMDKSIMLNRNKV